MSLKSISALNCQNYIDKAPNLPITVKLQGISSSKCENLENKLFSIESRGMDENGENDQGHAQKYRKIPVPTQYREGAKILKQIVEEGKSLKELVYNNKHIVS